ncbi:BrxE family protein [Stigmatella aurantiaca]|uniref:BrxE family protein n=1 Tax=Stigmatella aurantiaca TaxID=41 RepID=UPI0011601F8F
MSQPVLVRIIRARLLVGALGERLRWWPSQFTSSSGRRNLGLVLPRSLPRAVVESVTLSARRHHDGLVPTHGLHLFRLGPAHEDAIAHHLASGALQLTMPADDRAEILGDLASFGAKQRSDLVPGPCLLGPPSRLRLHDAVDEIAGAYAWAAQSGHVTVPYFAEVDG